MNYILRKATIEDGDRIWEILQQAIKLRQSEGSEQWQDGYPNQQSISQDIAKEQGYVFIDQEQKIIAYVAVIFDNEPAYDTIEGAWLSDNQEYTVIHRLAVAQDTEHKGLGTRIMQAIEDISKANHRYSIKVDTNFDNGAMLHIFNKLGYQYCGEVYLRGAPRKAFEKLLN